jgi:hypothetical protein
MKTDAFLLTLAEKICPQLKAGRFFATVKGKEYYFSGLLQRRVMPAYRGFYDEFDYAFSVHCTFAMCDVYNGARWMRLDSRENFFATPAIIVVERSQFDFSPAQTVERMKQRYFANTLLAGEYFHPSYSKEHLKRCMEAAGLHFFLSEELEMPVQKKIIPDAAKEMLSIRRIENNNALLKVIRP